MEQVVVLLAIIGAWVVVRFLHHAFGGTARVMKAANRFQATSIEAVNAVRDTPDDEFRQIRAIASWEQARTYIASLSISEQRLTAETLRDRGFPTSEVVRALTTFIELKDRENPSLDQQLAEMIQGAARSDPAAEPAD